MNVMVNIHVMYGTLYNHTSLQVTTGTTLLHCLILYFLGLFSFSSDAQILQVSCLGTSSTYICIVN